MSASLITAAVESPQKPLLLLEPVPGKCIVGGAPEGTPCPCAQETHRRREPGDTPCLCPSPMKCLESVQEVCLSRICLTRSINSGLPRHMDSCTRQCTVKAQTEHHAPFRATKSPLAPLCLPHAGPRVRSFICMMH